MNYGVIEGKRETDYLGGTLPYEVRTNGDWTPYLPSGETQTNSKIDYMSCVTYSALNSIEAQYRFLTGKEINLSDRFTAKMSGTTPQGNYLYAVADSIRKDGVVPEEEWPTNISYTWEQHYADIPQSVKDKAKEFLKDWEVTYEWIDFDRMEIMKHLKHAPIQVTIPGHAVLCFYTEEQVSKYFDSYAPYIKERTLPFVSAMKIVLNKKMTKDEVTKLYKLAFYRLPDAEELAYWTGKSLDTFLSTAIADRAKFLSQ